eukprot:TRINITY_DN7358_c0_g1_i1.p1 TRINITY_DN7358_c0_g1~~TRINITY_DN7358_c0_g1_i1.p1  ORF type:complete len:300 (+),score=49.53 TRINITY_DN7358_c0_g1_i1:117-902(+)
MFCREDSRAPSFLTAIAPLLSLSVSHPQMIEVGVSLNSLIAFVFQKFVFVTPSLVRVWFSDLSNRGLIASVDKYVSKHISPKLIESELSQIHMHNKQVSALPLQEVEYSSYLTPEGSTFTIKALPSSNQIEATYEKDDVTAVMMLTISANPPLRVVKATPQRRIGVKESTWKKWLLSMTTLLLTQDTPVVQAIVKWQKALDKRFDGVELCPICYSVFHAQSLATPNRSCSTCNTTYHSACLYKWFHVSHKNECPMCKSSFS